MTRVHWSAMKAVPALKRFRSGLKMSFCAGIFTSAFVLSSCSPPEIHGSYDVEIEIVGVSEILSGTMILRTGLLDVPPLGAEERSAFGDWMAEESVDSNSCFILAPISGSEEAPHIVQIFETRLEGGEISLPIELIRMPPLRIKVVRMQFFANAVAGEVLFSVRDQEHEGRITGVRSGPPSAQRCLEEYAGFRANLRGSTVSP